MPNFTYKISISLISLLLFFSSCDDITEENLEGVSVDLISPGNNFVSPSGSIDFIWDDTEGAEQYRLQIATPDFDSLDLLILDTTIVSNEYSYLLSPGDYQWRVRAENNFSIGDYSSRFVSVDSALLLTGANIILNAPASNAYSNQESISFNWNDLPNAEQYRFQINLSNGELINELIVQESNHFQVLDEGEFEWSVQGLNANSVSNVSSRILTVDRTAPSSPSAIFPANNFEFPSDTTFQFNWTSGTDINPVHDSLFIYNESTNPFTLIYAEPSTVDTEWNSSGFGIGQYSWELITYDDAGNRSSFSSLNFFEVLP